MSRRRDDESGAVAIVVALSLLVLMAGLTIAIDGGALRLDRREGQTGADFAVLAGSGALAPHTGYEARKACDATWTYLIANTPGVPAGTPTPCGAFDTLIACDALTPRRDAVAIVGDLRLTISMPVHDGDPLMQNRLDPETDGWSCERIAVTVDEDRDHVFGAAVGNPDATVVTSAVARAFRAGQSGEFASLIVLDRTGCHALLTSGQGAVIVQDGGDLPGLIAVDSTASAPGNDIPGCVNPNTGFAIDVKGNVCAPCKISATGAIFSYAARVLPGPGRPYDPDDVDQGLGYALGGKPIRVEPIPIPGPLVTRSPIDHRFNCRATYTLETDINNPGPGPFDAIKGCTNGGSAHIDNLVAAYGTVSSRPVGWLEYPTDVVPAVTCNESGAAVVLAGGPWYVNCGLFNPGTSISFTDPGTVLFKGGVDVKTTGVVTVNSANTRDTLVYLQNGDLEVGGTLAARRTFTYVQRGRVRAVGGSHPFTMIAPIGPALEATCAQGMYPTGPLNAPPIACFEDLVLWSNSAKRHTLGGQLLLDIEGTFFTPNAGRPGCSPPGGCGPFTLDGQADQVLDHAQFVSHRIEVSGQGQIRMRPDPDRTTPAAISGGGLIR